VKARSAAIVEAKLAALLTEFEYNRGSANLGARTVTAADSLG